MTLSLDLTELAALHQLYRTNIRWPWTDWEVWVFSHFLNRSWDSLLISVLPPFFSFVPSVLPSFPSLVFPHSSYMHLKLNGLIRVTSLKSLLSYRMASETSIRTCFLFQYLTSCTYREWQRAYCVTVLKRKERKGSRVNPLSFKYFPRSQLNDGLFITATKQKKLTERKRETSPMSR